MRIVSRVYARRQRSDLTKAAQANAQLIVVQKLRQHAGLLPDLKSHSLDLIRVYTVSARSFLHSMIAQDSRCSRMRLQIERRGP